MPFSIAIAALVLLQTWVLQPLVGERWVVPLGAAVLILGLLHAWRSGDWGWSARAFLPGALAALTFTIVLAGMLVGLGAWLGAAGSRDFSLAGMGWLLVWGGAQQWLLQTTFLREAEKAAAGRLGWLTAPALFGVLHLPNPFLTIVTATAAAGWCAVYRRFPNVVPLGISHAVGTRLILAVFDAETTGRLRVGSAYLGL